MYYSIFDTLQNWLFGGVPVEPWQISGLHIGTIVFIVLFVTFVVGSVFAVFRSLFKWR